MSYLRLNHLHKRLYSASGKCVNEVRLQYELEKRKRNEYVRKNTLNFNLRDLRIGLNTNAPIDLMNFKYIFNNLVENKRKIDWNFAVTLIKAMGVYCIDLFQHERQTYANNFLEMYLNEHKTIECLVLNVYLETSFYNRYRISENKLKELLRNAKNSKRNVKTITYVTRELCFNGLPNQAIDYLKSYPNKLPEECNLIVKNSFIHSYFNVGEEKKAIEEFKRLNDCQLPSADTFYTLLIGYIHLGQTQKALELFESVKDLLQGVQLLNLYEYISALKIGQIFKDDLIVLMKQCSELVEFKMNFCQTIMNLIVNNNLNDAVYLVKNVYEHEYCEEDVDKIDVYINKVNVLRYFMKYMIKTEQKFDDIKKIIDDFESKLTQNQNYQLKNITYEALVNNKWDMSLQLIELMFFKNLDIKWHFFMPLIKNILRRIQQNYESKLDNRVKIQSFKDTKEFNDLKHLFSIMSKYRCLNSIGDLETFYHSFFEDLNFYFIEIDLFELSHLSIEMPETFKFNLFLKKITSILSRNLIYNQNLDSIKRDFKHINDWINKNASFTIEDNFYLHLNDFFNEIERQNLTKQVFSQMSFEDSLPSIIASINNRRFKKLIKPSVLLNQVNEKFLMNFIKFNNFNQDMAKKLAKFYLLNKITSSINFASTLKNEFKDKEKLIEVFVGTIADSDSRISNSDFTSFLSDEYSDSSIEQLEDKITMKKSKGEEPLTQIRHLLQLLCNEQSYLSKKTLNRINEIENELTITNAHNSSTYSSLMFFYSTRLVDFDKAKHYYEKLKEHNQIYIDLYKIIKFVELCIKHNYDFNYIHEVVKNFKSNKAFDYLKEPMEQFCKSLFWYLNPREFDLMTNTLVKNNYLNCNTKIRRYIISRYLKYRFVCYTSQ